MEVKFSCAFSGNRVLPLNKIRGLAIALQEQIEGLISRGVYIFYAGGALGFDTLAALSVIEKRILYPHIKLHLVVPYKGQENFFSAKDKTLFFDIMRQSDEVFVLEKEYVKGAYHARNRYMVDRCHYLICFNEKEYGGTAYTMNYAFAQGAEVIDLNSLLETAEFE